MQHSRFTNVLLTLLCSLLTLSLVAQNPGDTIKVKTIHYGSNTRDTLIQFPDGSLTYEKIILRYNMRCKNALVSNSDNRNLGCGEWDYSCNTYLADSSRVEEVPNIQPRFVISRFKGNTFRYTSVPVYDFYRRNQQQVILNTIHSDSTFVVGAGTTPVSGALPANQFSGRSQFLYLASELTAAGLSAGPIHSIILRSDSGQVRTGFLRLQIKHTDSTGNRSNIPELIGLTEVFYSDFVFVPGSNRIVFKNPFTWNGSQNLLLEFSFTNAQKQPFPVPLLGETTTVSMGRNTTNGYNLDLSNNGHVKLDSTGFSRIRNEMTIAFWAYGDRELFPASTSILYGTDNNSNNRQLNIHLPHSSKNIYFDCGFAAGGYDRIFKPLADSTSSGRWNHWTFTKNATTGVMSIYLNGVLWHSETGKTKPITLLNLILGKDVNLQNNFVGRVSELAIWNTTLSDSLIRKLQLVHPTKLESVNVNLISSYNLNEGDGMNIQEQVNNKTITGTNLGWKYERGNLLTRNFMPLLVRPEVTFCRGNYNITSQLVPVMDSVVRMVHYIDQYSIQSNGSITPMINDVVNLDTNYINYFSAAPSKIYNAETDTLTVIDSIQVNVEGTLVLSNLTWYRRFPWFNEILSFVTPYGIGLDLGVNGKTWYFDVSDFAPLLKGKKRLVMTLGGQNQEQNDLEFWFVVGTPPRPVLAINQIWQGTSRTGAASIGSINNETRYSPLSVPTLSTGKSFKIRSSITGHGAEGEFESNGGPVTHMLNLNGGATEFSWNISIPCGFNPVFPQGGTWVYDRQGWCPGLPSLLKEFDVTALITPGNSLTFDYNTSTPQKSGAYNYQIAHQLVTYGSPSFTLDASIAEVFQPSDKIQFGRINPVCTPPRILLQNTGSANLSKVSLKYWINQNGTKQTYTWNGNLKFMETDTVTLPIGSLWTNGILSNSNVFYVEIEQVNDQTDSYALNNRYMSPFQKPEVVPGNFTIDFRTNNYGTENAYFLLDADGKLIDSKIFTTANTLYTNNYTLDGCYTLIVTDAGNDGLSWWANPNQGTGFVRIKRPNGSVLKTFQPDFGSRFEYRFTTDWLLNAEEVTDHSLFRVYPNPTREIFTLDGPGVEKAEFELIDVMGKQMQIQMERNPDRVNFLCNNLYPGYYMLLIKNNGNRFQKMLLIIPD